MAYERLVKPEYIERLLEKEAGACNPLGTKWLAKKFAKAYRRLRELESIHAANSK